MGQRGGKRPGAGRKKEQRTIESEKARETVIRMVTEQLTPIMEAQIESAKGLWYEETFPGGVRKVFKQKPDIAAGKNLLDQTIGKAKETVELHQFEILDDDENSPV